MILLFIFILSLLVTKLLIITLTKARVMDLPNQRSNHKLPTPRGGGIAIILAMLVGMLMLKPQINEQVFNVILLALPLAILFFIDDLKGMNVLVRFVAQIIAVVLAIKLLPGNKLVCQGLLPLWADRFVAGFLLLGFINAFNFMDGIDGIAASQTIHIAGAIALMTVLFRHLPPNILMPCLIIVAAALGFLLHNWHPARIFMGDVGSVTLGLILGWLLLYISAYGYWVQGVIIPLYYLVDTSVTMLKRALQGKKIWQAHSEHFYQQAVRNGSSHARVTQKIIGANLLLTIIASMSAAQSVYAILASLLVVSLLLSSL